MQLLASHALPAVVDALPDEIPEGAVTGALASSLRIVAIVVIAFMLNRVAKRLIKRLIRSMKDEGVGTLSKVRARAPLADTRPLNIQRATLRTETIGGVLRSLTTFVIWAIALMMILDEVGVSLGPLIAGAGIVGVALGFGAQKLVQDFLSGIFMLLEDQFGLGDFVDIAEGEILGVVEGISLRTTRIRDIRGTLWHVPNGEVRLLGNLSQEWSRALLDIGVAYHTDVDKAAAIMKQAADEMAAEHAWASMFVESAEIWGVQALADSEVTIRMVVKVVPAKQWSVERELRKRIKQAFDTYDVEIPFPQRTVWMRPQEPAATRDGSPAWDAGSLHVVNQPAEAHSGPAR